MSIGRAFTRHPSSIGETYFQHMRMAFGFGLAMFGAALACLVHGVLPFMFVSTGSSTVFRLHAKMAGRGRAQARERIAPQATPNSLIRAQTD